MTINSRLKPTLDFTVSLELLIKIFLTFFAIIGAYYAMRFQLQTLGAKQEEVIRVVNQTAIRSTRIEYYLSAKDSRYWETTAKIRVDPAIVGAALSGSASADSGTSKH